MPRVGESTGALQEMLNSLSDFYDEEIETSLTRFITIVEPTLLVIMGIIIAALRSYLLAWRMARPASSLQRPRTAPG